MANIIVDPQVSPFSYTGGTQQVTVTYDVAPAYVSAVTVSDSWIGVSISSSAGSDTTIVVYNVTVSENNGQYRTGSVTFKCGGSGSATTSVNIIRQGTGVVVNRPLWKDTYYEISGYTEFNYSIAYNGNRVYSGKSYKAPDNTYIRFNVTKIAQDWIHQSISDIRTLDDDVVQNEDGAGVLSLCDEFGTEIFNWKYLYQYDGEWSGESHYNMSEPVNGHSDPRMKLFYTQYDYVNYYVYPDNLWFVVTGGTQQFMIVAPSDMSWSMTSVPQWVTLSSTAGTGTTTIAVTVGETQASSDLNDDIVIHFVRGVGEFGDATVSVRQSAPETETVFTLEFVDNGNIVFAGQNENTNIKYSFNRAPYQSIAANETYIIPGVSGDTIKFECGSGGSAYGLRVSTATTAHYRAYGLLLSLHTPNYSGSTVVPENQFYEGMFKKTKIVDASNLMFPTGDLTAFTNDSLYSEMFAGCTKLVTSPSVLPSTVLSNNCYYGMFSGCTSLSAGPVISALTLANGCCYGMFSGCTSLTSAPVLLATTLARGCCDSMFKDCTSLTVASIPPATSLTKYDSTTPYGGPYAHMYEGCTSLTLIPTLPATSVGHKGYECMFAGCTSLFMAPTMNAVYVEDYNLVGDDDACYAMFSGCTALTTMAYMPNVASIGVGSFKSMYEGCTSLVTTYALPNDQPGPRAYEYMFKGCTSLVSAPAIGITVANQEVCHSMFEGCTSLVNPPTMGMIRVSSACCESMFAGCTSLVNGPELPATSISGDCYAHMFSGCTSLMSIKCMATSGTGTNGWVEGVNTYDGVFEGSDNYDWEALTYGNNGLPSNWSRANIPLTLRFNYYDGYSDWFTLRHNRTLVSDVGDLTVQYRMGRPNYDNSISWSAWTNVTSSSAGTSVYPTRALVQFRGDNAKYGSLPLSYTTFSGSTFYKAYGNLMSLINSTGYTSAKTISEQYAFNRFFAGTALDNAEHLVMPATGVPMHCYTSMFQGNTNLTSAPTLPAPTLANSCYNEMFRDCPNLSYIRCLATDVSAYNCTYNWVNGVAASGTFVKASGMTGWESGNNGIPANWTIIE